MLEIIEAQIEKMALCDSIETIARRVGTPFRGEGIGIFSEGASVAGDEWIGDRHDWGFPNRSKNHQRAS
jgi:hypothetical protein